VLNRDIHAEGAMLFSNCLKFICSPTKNNSRITPICDMNFMSHMLSVSKRRRLICGRLNIIPDSMYDTTRGIDSARNICDVIYITIRQASIVISGFKSASSFFIRVYLVLFKLCCWFF